MNGTRAVAAALAGLAATAAAMGCGSSSSGAATATAATMQAAPRFAPRQVERMIRRSIQPGLAANLGKGARMTVTCKATGSATLRCVTVLIPPDASTDRIKVIYGVKCTLRTCSWQPIG